MNAVVSGAVKKLKGWKPQVPPPEDDDMLFHRKLLEKIIISVVNEKVMTLRLEGTLPQKPIAIHLSLIFDAFVFRRHLLDECGLWRWKWHGRRWIDRRVNEICNVKYNGDKEPKVVSSTGGWYLPNPKIYRFEDLPDPLLSKGASKKAANGGQSTSKLAEFFR